MIWVTGVNDNGEGDFGKTPIPGSRPFIHYSGGGVTYGVPSGAYSSEFNGRNDNGVTVGIWSASNNIHAFMKHGSTLTPIVDPKALPYGTWAVGINKYNTVVGYYLDGGGNNHGYKRYSNNTFIGLNYPGAQQTFPSGINDIGAIVGTYTTPSLEHGFIYHNGQWAKLDPFGPGVTELWGISNTGVIVGTHYGNSFLYANGKTKMISVPNSIGTTVHGIAPGGLIAGTVKMSNGYHGFIAACH